MISLLDMLGTRHVLFSRIASLLSSLSSSQRTRGTGIQTKYTSFDHTRPDSSKRLKVLYYVESTSDTEGQQNCCGSAEEKAIIRNFSQSLQCLR